MATVDSLEIEIQSTVDDVNKSLDALISKLGIVAKGISAIKSNKGLDEFAKEVKSLSSNMKPVQDKAKEMGKAIDDSIKNASKSLEQINEQYKDLGKDFQFFGNSESVQKKIDSLSNSLETAKLKKEELEAAGKTEGTMYENAVKDVIKYSNQIESLKKQLSDKSSNYVDISKMSDDEWTEFYQNLPTVKARAEEAAQSIKYSFEQVSEPLKEIDSTLSDFSVKATEALSAPQEESKKFSSNLNGLKEVLYGIQERLLEFKGRLENTFVSKGLKTYTSEYVELQNQITKTEKTLATLNAQMARSKETVKKFERTTSYRKMQYDIKAARDELQRLREEQDRLEVTGGATKWNFNGLSNGAKSFAKTLHPLQNSLKKISSTIKSFLSKVGKLAKSMISLGRATKKSNASFSDGLKTILKYGFGIRSLYVLFNKLRNAVKEGMKNLVQYSERTNQSVSMLSSSMNQFKNASASAFAPILNAIATILNTLIQLFIKAANAVNQFFAALTGQGTWIKAKYVYKDVSDGISKASKAANGALQPFDALNNLTTQDSGAGAVSPGDMFETVPIEDKFKKLADKIKDIFSKIFEPLKKAWNKEGKFVMNSWKYALDEIRKLIKDIGRDFLEVWNQPGTVDALSDILHIIGDIGLAVGHLARNFREAWNENKTGLHILENIRDIFAVIIANIRHAADATVEWADKLDFSPLLEAFERFTESLIPVADSLSGILTDFYEKVLLPLGKWTIEKGLPELLDVFTAFNKKVDWETLRSNLAEFWEHLEPFSETVGEGLILFIERVSDALADFLNSQEFKDFLVSVEEWMDNVEPEDVADALENIAKGIIALKIATVGFGVGAGLLSFLANLAIVLKVFGGGSLVSSSVGGLKSIGGAIDGWTPHIAVGIAIAGVLGKIKEAMESKFDTSNWSALDWISNTLETSLNGWKSQFEGFKISLELWWQDTWMSDAIWRFGQWWDEKVSPWFTKEKWSELWENVKSAFETKWGEIKEWWNNTAIAKWWKEDVEPNFTKKKWEDTIKGVKEAFESTWNDAISSVKSIWNQFANSLNDKLNISIPAIKIGGKTLSESVNLNLGKIPTFATGGFPEDGLFMANHGELVGQFSNGKTAVANNEQITVGIEEASYRGMMRALQESGGFNTSVNVTLEERAGRFLEVIKEEYRTEAKRIGAPSVPVWG